MTKRKDSMKRKNKRGPDPSIKGLQGYECGGNEKLAKEGESPMPICEKMIKHPPKWPDLVKKMKKKNPKSRRLELCRLLGVCSVVAQFRQIFVLFATQKDVMWFKMVVGTLRCSWIPGRSSRISCCDTRPPRKGGWANGGLWQRDQSCECSTC